MSKKVSRRDVISLIAAIPIVGVAVGVAAAADDSGGTKAQFKYTSEPGPGGKKCADCALFQAPSSCPIVKGTIVPTGYCIAFAAKPK